MNFIMIRNADFELNITERAFIFPNSVTLPLHGWKIADTA